MIPRTHPERGVNHVAAKIEVVGQIQVPKQHLDWFVALQYDKAISTSGYF